MKKLTPYQHRILRLVYSSTSATIALFFAIASLNFLFQGNMVLTAVFLALASLAMSVFYVVRYFFEEKRKAKTIRFFGVAGFYLVLAVIGSLTFLHHYFFYVYSIVFGVVIAYSAVFSFFQRRSVRAGIFMVLRLAFAIILPLATIRFNATPEEARPLFVFIELALAAISFGSAMMMVFGGVRRSTIGKIMKKTYTVEILYGLIVLMVATALVLSVTEEEMTNFGDALWYCFTLVTTIGFGDLQVHNIIGRILSVVLGIYGIIVVALITSIIVNFYSETKAENPSVPEENKEDAPALPQEDKKEKKDKE